MGKASIGLRAAALASVAAITLAACGGGDGGDDGAGTPGGDGEAQKGGTLTFLTLEEQFTNVDPQRVYTGEHLAFFGAYTTRTLNSFKYSTDEAEAQTLVNDLATDTGTPNEDATSWEWTLKDGLTWEDGSELTCEDVKYGVSRTFATDIITNGPQYAVSMLDIPTDKDGASVYKGPYVTDNNDTAAFDEAVVCEGNKITFNLNKPVADFNYTVTLLSFAPVPKAADTGEKYDDKIVSNGPYKIQEYSKGSQMVLIRNDNWDPETETDGYRPAYPDRIVVKFGLESSVIGQRLIQDSGEDQTAVTQDPLDVSLLATAFGSDRFADRRFNELDPYVRYYALNVSLLPNLEHRKAIAAALDRAQLLTIAGGEYAGDLADGVIKPNLPAHYAETGMFEGDLLGQPIPPEGDPAYAEQLIEQSGEPMPSPVQFDYPQTPTNDKAAAAVVSSLGKAGIKVKPNPIEAGAYYGIVFDPKKAGHIISAGWGPDWPNASTIVPELFTPSGGFNLSQADDKGFNQRVEEAKAEIDPDAQAELWKALNKEAMANVWAVPTRFGREQRLAGSKVHSASGEDQTVYHWAPYGSWPYGDMWVEQ